MSALKELNMVENEITVLEISVIKEGIYLILEK